MSVKTTHRDYDRLAPLWKRARDVVAGQQAMHKAGTEYLPRLKAEDDTEYKARKARSDFFNATWRTISGLSGMAFRKPPQSDLPGILESYSDDITMSGINLDAFAEMTVEEIMEVGRFGILVDHPPELENVSAITQATAENMGQRPFLSFYLAETITNWKFARVNNAWVLAMVVLKEDVEVEGEDEFEAKCEERWRVLDLDENGFYRQRVFRHEDGKDIEIGTAVYPKMNRQPLTYIPFRIIGRSGMGDAIDEPPLIDLVDKNVAHYQVNSDYRHGAHFTALPTLFLAGIQDDAKNPIYIGGSAAITSTDPNARGEFIEFKGQGLGALESQLDRIEKQMAALGAQMIVEPAAPQATATAAILDTTGENSILARICIVASEAITWGLTVMGDWSNVTEKPMYEISREFLPTIMDAQKLIALFQLWQGGGISMADLLDNLQRGDVVRSDKTLEEHEMEIGEQLSLPAPNDGQIAA